MKLNPQQAPLYGECLLTVQLGDEDHWEDEEDVEFYLLFAGTNQRHLTSTLRISHVTLQAVCPAHDCSESVQVTLCSARPGGSVDPVAEERFQFVQDLAFDMAQFLVSAAGQADGLEGALLLDECQIPLQECERLDDSLSLALRHLVLPQGWSVLGTNVGTPPAEPGPHETLLHFAARRGLRKVALFLLQQPGGREALRLPNKQGSTPVSVAEKRGHDQLHQLFTEVETLPETRIKAEERQCYPGGRALQHHPRLNTYTLTVDTVPGKPPPSLQGEVEKIRKLIRSHRDNKLLVQQRAHTVSHLKTQNQISWPIGDHVFQQQSPDELNTTAASSDISNTSAHTALHPQHSHGHLAGGALPCPNGQPEEGEAGPAQAAVKDSVKAPDKRSEAAVQRRKREGETPAFSVPSCGNQQEEADRERTGVTTARQSSKAGRRKRNKEEREKRRAETETGDKAAASPTTVTPAMGHAQSQEHPEHTEHTEAKHWPLKTGEGSTGNSSSSCGDTRAQKTMEGQGEPDNIEEMDSRAAWAQIVAGAPLENGQHDGHSGGEVEVEYAEAASECTLQTMTGAVRCHQTQAQAAQSEDAVQRQEITTAVTRYSEKHEWANNSSQIRRSETERGGDCGGKSEEGNPSQQTNGSTESARSRSGETDTNSMKQSPSMAEGESESSRSHGPSSVTAPEPSEQVLDQPAEGTVEVVVPPPQNNQDGAHSQGHEAGQECEEQASTEDGERSSIEKWTMGPQHSDDVTDHTPSRQEGELVQLDSCSADKLSEEGTVTGEETPIKKKVSVQWASLEEVDSLPCREEIAATAVAVVAIAVAAAVANIEQCNSNSMLEASQLQEAVDGESEHQTGPKDTAQRSGVTVSEATETLTSDGDPTVSPCEGDVMDKNPSKGEDEPHLLQGEESSDLSKARPGNENEVEARLAGLSLTKGESVAVSRECGDSHPQIDMLLHDERAVDRQSDEVITSSSTISPERSSELTHQEAIPESPATPVHLHTASDSDSGTAQSSELTSPSELDSGTGLGEEKHSSSVKVDSGLSLGLQSSDTLASLDGVSERTLDTKVESSEALRPLDKSVKDKDTQGEEKGKKESVSDTEDSTLIHREKETFYPVQSCTDPTLQVKTTITESTEFPVSPCSESVGGSLLTTGALQDSVSDVDSLGEDSVFRKAVDRPRDSTSGVSVSFSSIDDVASVGPLSASSHGSVGPLSVSSQGSMGPPWAGAGAVRTRASWSSGDTWQTTGKGGEEEERKDKLTEGPVCSSIMRPCIRSLSPFRRHSWGPGKNPEGETDMNQRSSLRSQGEGKPRKPTFHRRSMSWCPSNIPPPHPEQIDSRSYSLEGLAGEEDAGKASANVGTAARVTRLDSEERGSLLSLTEEQESDLGDCSSLDSQKSGRVLPVRRPPMPHQVLTKSVSMLAISHRDLDANGRTRPKRHISFSFSIPKSRTLFSIGSSSSDEEEVVRMGSFSSTSGSLEYSISEEDPGPLQNYTEGRQGTKVSRTFSYLKSKMSTKKNKEKDKEKGQGKEKDTKEKKTLNGHLFSSVNPAPSTTCHQCNKPINTKEAFLCTNCNAQVHKGCRESLPVCVKVKMKQQKQQTVVDSASVSGVMLRCKSTSSSSRERPWSAISSPDNQAMVTVAAVVPRRNPSILSSNLSKSISISNIAGPLMDEMPMKGLKYLSQSTDSLHKISKVNESTESLTDEGTEMMDSQLMGEFEAESKDLEADSWTFTVDKKYVKGLKKEVVKRQDVIYELVQTEMHHVRTLRIMSEVYSKGLQKEVQLETQVVERVFPMLDELLELHTHFFTHLLERKRESSIEGRDDGSFLIRKIGDVLVSQFSGPNADRMKKVYGKFCSRHNEAVNFYKELHTKDKRFQAFIKKKMSSTIVRRLGIPECILLVTQRITKYPVLLQRILQHTKENEEDHEDITQALRLVKEILNAVDSKVNEHDKKKRLKEVYSRTDSKSIQRMKSGQMFAREDLVRGRRLLHDGPLQLKNSAGRLKDVQAMLLSDVFVFLQEKDQKYVFASLDQRSTVISLQKLIVREVANEERGLFLITAGIEKPEMVEVLASTKEERNTWMQLIQDAMHSIEKDDDEGIPSETEEDKRLLETKAREMRELLRKKDEQIVCLLKEKLKVFRDMCEGGSGPAEETSPAQSIRTRMLFRATPDYVTKGEPIMKDALREVETLHVLVNGSLGGAVGQQVSSTQDASGGSVGPVCLPRRAETFGGFDSHQMNISKNGEKEEGDDSLDLRRTESDSVLKKGGNNNLLLLLKRNSEVLHSVTHLHDLLNTLQAVVVQQDTFIENQRHALAERPASRHSSTSSLSSTSSRPNSLIEQEKQRSLEKQRQEVANLQRQQAAHVDERRRREREWEVRESGLSDREAQVKEQDEEAARRRRQLEEERQELQRRKEEYQRDLERLRDAQRKLDRDRETLRREAEMVEQMKKAEAEQAHRTQRTPSSTSEESMKFQSSTSLDKEPGGGEAELSSSPATKDPFLRMGSKRKGKNLNPFSSSSSSSNASSKAQSSTDGQNQIPNRLMQLAKTKDKKEKKKKKGKGQSQPDPQNTGVTGLQADGEIFFC
ncbi:A-kinase anchor protein 13-like isoform X3 [Coregonus clupeaformis]|uniref:A-kinase anchor protein 13-like isoform X3 n=1 Tax=Coregonus clupeaformis TaxID=59861 RepID=UPI001E1C4267|nr:A-kinase anchor protein 13-like isoform X3 [Coregonus clupeaformis]